MADTMLDAVQETQIVTETQSLANSLNLAKQNNQSNSAHATSSNKRSAKALFTLAYMVSYELKRLLQVPAVMQLVQ